MANKGGSSCGSTKSGGGGYHTSKGGSTKGGGGGYHTSKGGSTKGGGGGGYYTSKGGSTKGGSSCDKKGGELAVGTISELSVPFGIMLAKYTLDKLNILSIPSKKESKQSPKKISPKPTSKPKKPTSKPKTVK